MMVAVPAVCLKYGQTIRCGGGKLGRRVSRVLSIGNGFGFRNSSFGLDVISLDLNKCSLPVEL